MKNALKKILVWMERYAAARADFYIKRGGWL